MSSKLDNAFDAPSAQKHQVTDAVLQWIMVICVLGATVYLAIVNNLPEIIFQLSTLSFGYYFGSRGSTLPPAR